MITKKSQFGVDETLNRLETTLAEKGIKTIARVNHTAAAKSVDMELRPTQVLFFGNPKLGTPLMQSDQLAGLDLPMRVLAWEDADGETWLAYHSPQSLAQRLELAQAAEAIGNLTSAMNALTDRAIAD